MTKRLLFTLALSLVAASGCNLVYKQNIQQGNALAQEDLDKLRLGMSMNQVAFLMGTPAIQDPFHHDRWDYISTFSRRGGDPVMRKVTLHFENGALAEMIGVEADEFIFEDEPADEAPTDEAPVSSMAETPAEAEITPLDAPVAEETSFEPTTAEPSGWVIQLGAFDDRAEAEELAQRLERAGYGAAVQLDSQDGSAPRYLVRRSGLESRESAEAMLQAIRGALGVNGFLVPSDE